MHSDSGLSGADRDRPLPPSEPTSLGSKANGQPLRVGRPHPVKVKASGPSSPGKGKQLDIIDERGDSSFVMGDRMDEDGIHSAHDSGDEVASEAPSPKPSKSFSSSRSPASPQH